MKLTERCTDLLTLLSSARWLTTAQVHRRYFREVSIEAARKRLRALEKGRYVFRFRENRMMESLFSLGTEGRRVVEERTGRHIRLERHPPKQLGHFVGINDLRLAAEACPGLTYFFACWELQALDWRYRLIPDAVFAANQRTFAVEFDRGEETLGFFVKTKITTYLQGLRGFPLAAVLIIADREARMRSLMKSIPTTSTKFLFSTMDRVRCEGLADPVFCDRAGTVRKIL